LSVALSSLQRCPNFELKWYACGSGRAMQWWQAARSPFLSVPGSWLQYWLFVL
jgi:hypothetical protein